MVALSFVFQDAKTRKPGDTALPIVKTLMGHGLTPKDNLLGEGGGGFQTAMLDRIWGE